MTQVKPSLPKGMRDFGPREVARRNYIIDNIREVFELFGYQPLETPAMEQMKTLTGKYGEEGEKLLFKVLNSGDFLKKADQDALAQRNSAKLAPSIAEKGMRYDLTIPFARYVVMNQNDLHFPFRRYQIQPVWRADRPQKGRYREFVQCDVDVIGSTSMINELELVQIYLEAFKRLGIDISIKINHRSLIYALAYFFGAEDRYIEFSNILDKIDKIGEIEVFKMLQKEGLFDLNKGATVDYNHILNLKQKANDLPANSKNIDRLVNYIQAESGRELPNNILRDLGRYQNLWSLIEEHLKNHDGSLPGNIKFEIFLARGLDYYTGTIFEVTANDAQMGSIGGGGRYDDLTGVFGLPDMSGVGISFGLDRIYDVMYDWGLFPAELASGSRVLFINFGGESEAKAFEYLTKLRQDGIRAELYPDDAKLKKQMKYANGNAIPYVIFIGEEELKEGKLQLKDMKSGEQMLLGYEELKERLRSG